MKKTPKIKIPKVTFLIVGLLLLTNAVSLYFIKVEGRANLVFKSCKSEFVFINPRFACGYTNMVDKRGYAEFKIGLNQYIEAKKAEGKAELVAVWFRDLESGPTFGINDRNDFIAASLLKVPLAMAYLAHAEDDAEILKRTIYADIKAEVPNQTFAPTETVEKDKSYTIDELIHHTIVYSDNVAAQLLYQYLPESLGEDALSHTYRDLGIIDPEADFNKESVNVKEYGSIFRVLYNVSYLNREMSEKMIELLVESDFKDGLRRGIPENIALANKFGERFRENGERQLHDCGIIYYPDNPYQLCVMTRGTNYEDLKTIIGEISKMTYEEFDSRRL